MRWALGGGGGSNVVNEHHRFTDSLGSMVAQEALKGHEISQLLYEKNKQKIFDRGFLRFDNKS